MLRTPAQLAGLLATALGIVSLQFQDVRTLLFVQMCGNFTFVLHYFMLGAYTACIGQIILSANVLVLCGRDGHTARRGGWKWLFSLLSLAACAISWQDIFSLLPCAASLVTILTNWSFDGRKIRLGKLLLSCPGWVVYDIHVGSWSGILCELVAMGSALLAVVRCRRKAAEES